MTLHVQWCKAHRKSKDTVTLIFCPMCLVEELERTAPKETPEIAKPEAPAPVREGVFVCPGCGAISQDDSPLVHAQGCRVPYFGAFPDLPAPTRTCTHVDETAPVPEDGKRDLRRSILCRIPAGELEDIRAEVDRLREQGAIDRDEIGRLRHDLAAMTEAKSHAESEAVRHFEERISEVDRLKAELAQAAPKERERIIALFAENTKRDTFKDGEVFLARWSILDGRVPINDEAGIRAALEPKPEVPRG